MRDRTYRSWWSQALLSAGAVSMLTLFAPPGAQGQTTIRPEVVIVLDTSGSMSRPPASSETGETSGADCGGDRKDTVDLCGDGLCSGLENGSSCFEDCNLVRNRGGAPGMAPACHNGWNANSKLTSRMFLVKRVLRNLLPALRDKVNLGLVTFQQNGFFEYFKADPANQQTKKVTVFLPALQLQLMGVWNSAGNAPPASFTFEGTSYTLLSGAGLSVTQDSLYRNQADATSERRFAFSVAGHSYSNAGATWQYLGSYYTYAARGASPTGIWNGWGGCTTAAPCSAGGGDCNDQDRHTCSGGTRCVANAGNQYWLPGTIDTGTEYSIDSIDVCEPTTDAGTVQLTYRGPQYVSGGDTWVYRRFVYDGSPTSTSQGLTPVDAGQLVISLAGDDTQAAVDAQLLKMLVPLSPVTNGGRFAMGFTPTGPAIATAAQHFADRTAGSGPFASGGPDPYALCRGRFALVLSDGQSNRGTAPGVAAQALYQQDPSNPIRTLAVAIPGLASSGLDELNQIADLGDNGVDDNSKSAFQAQDEQGLITALEEAMAFMIGGGGGDVAGGGTICTRTCSSTNPCPADYDCINNTYCLPKPPPMPDGGLPPDSSVPTPDSGMPVADSSVPTPDSGMPVADSSVPTPDSGIPVADSSVPDQAIPDAPLEPDLSTDAGPEPDVAAASDLSAQEAGAADLAAGEGQGYDDTGASAHDGAGVRDGATAQGDGSSAGNGGSGCDCAVASSGAPVPWLLLLGLVALLVHRRRR